MDSTAYEELKTHVRELENTEYELKKTKNQLQLSNKMLNALSEIQSQYIIDSNPSEIFNKLLENLLELTESEYGFIGEVLYTSENKPYLKTHSITNIAWNKETKSFHKKNKEKGFEFYNLNTLFGAVLKTRKPVISNDPTNDHRAGGIPEGHPPLNSFMGIPIISKKRLIGMVGIANRRSGYNKKLIDFLKPFMSTCSNLILAIRNDFKRREAEESLMENEKKYRGLFENSTDFMYTLDLKGNFTDVNRAAAGLTGYSKKELIGMNYRDYTPGKDHKKISSAYLNILKTNKPLQDFPLEVIIKDGDTKYFETSVTTLLKRGKIIGFHGTSRDITKRKKAEKIIKKSEEYYRDLVDKAEIAISIEDKNGNILFANENNAKLHGYNVEEMKKLSFIDLIHPDDYDMVLNNHKKRLKGKEMPRYEFKGIKKDGSIVYFEVDSSILIEDGKITGTRTYLWDITERKKAEKTIIESENRYRTLFEDSPISLWEEDFSDVKEYIDNLKKSGINNFRSYFGEHPEQLNECMSLVKIIDVNKRTVSLFAAKNKNELLKNLGKVFAEESFNTFKDEIIAIAEGKTTFESETVNQTLKGEKKHIYLKWSAAPGYEKTLSKAIVSIIDITERKKAEETLANERLLLRNVIDNLPDFIYLKDLKGRFILSNISNAAAFDKKPADIIGKTDFDLLPKKLAEKSYDEEKEILNSDKPEINKEMHSKDRKRWGLYSKIPLKNTEGENIGLIGINSNITLLKMTENALRESEEKFRNIFEHANDSIVYTDKYGKILEANNKSVKIYGTDKEKLIGNHFNEIGIFDGDDIKLMWKDFRKVLSGKKATINLTIKDKEGQERYLESSASLIKKDGRIHGVMVISRDITDRITAEEEKERLLEHLYQSQKLEAVGRLAGGIAHEFNNILGSIMGHSEMLKLKYEGTDSKEERAADVIIRSSERGASLTQQLLGYARGGKYNPLPLNMNDIIIETVKITEPSFAKTVKVDYKLEPNIKNIIADYNQILQVLTNLILNAKDAMPIGGNLTFESENIYIDELDVAARPDLYAGHYVKISISDSGIGIPEGMQDMIFEPFFTTKDVGKGTGLGLATVHGIVKNHGGNISCFSEQGEGTTFELLFPAIDRTILKLKKEEGKEVIELESGTVFVIDDEEEIRNTAKILLESLGYNVLLADSGKEAVKTYKMKHNEIDVVLLDVIMPEMDGKSIYKKLKEINPDVKTLIISGFSKEGRASDMLRDGALGFVQKPFRRYDLAQIIRNTILKNTLK
ncbi:PAS domain S-box protein [candidate division KSB1 bacterium]